MDPVRVGVIGCGVIGQVHLDRARRSPYLMPVALAELREGVRQATAERFGIARAYDSAEKLLRDKNVEAVVLAMPTSIRAVLGPKVLKAGKHLLMEKPVAMNAKLVRKLMALQGDKVVACCSGRNRFNGAAKAVTEKLASGALGDLRVIRYRCTKPAGELPATPPPPWRLNRGSNGGGILVNWGSYDLDFLLGVTGWTLRPRTVLARMWTVPPTLSARAASDSDAETHITALVQCEGGVVLQYERSEFTPCAGSSLCQFLGTEGSLRLDGSIEQTTRVDMDTADAQQGVVSENLWTGKVVHEDAYVDIIEDFALAVRGVKPPITDIRQGLLVQELTDAMYKSAMAGKAVNLA